MEIYVTAKKKTKSHPLSCEHIQDACSDIGFVINGVEGGPIHIEKDKTYTFHIDSPGHPFYFTQDNRGGRGRNDPLQLSSQEEDQGTFSIKFTNDIPDTFYYQCRVHPYMGGKVIVKKNVNLAKIGSIPSPIAVAGPDNNGILYVANQEGNIYKYMNNKLIPFVSIKGHMIKLNPGYDERGLLDLVHHNNKLYVFYTNINNNNCLSEIDLSDLSENVILRIPHQASIHNGGRMMFEGDNLYITIGDGGPQKDPQGNAQNLVTLLGKIIRININGNGRTYGIPKDNPFINTIETKPEIYAYGFRNPWGIGRNSNGIIYVADAGYLTREEINILQKGGNYGWNIKEGTVFTKFNDKMDSNLIDPIFEYPKGEIPGINKKVVDSVIIGGKFLNIDKYVFGDYSGKIMVLENGKYSYTIEIPETIRSFSQDDKGNVYLLTGMNKNWESMGNIYLIT